MTTGKQSVTRGLVERLRQQITGGELGDGTRLPSIRQGAQRFGVSPSTMVEVYDRLTAQGLMRAQRGVGFFVLRPRAGQVMAPAYPPLRPRNIDPLWVSRQSLDAPPGMLKPGCGWLPDDWLPGEELARGLRAVSREPDAGLVAYGGTRGLAALRHYLQMRLAHQGAEVDSQQIMLTGSGTQALDLLCRMMLSPGDTVLVDDPCYFNFQALLSVHRVTVIGVPFTPNGPDVAEFARLVAEHRPRIYLTNSGVHNPTGATLSLQTAFQVLNVAVSAGVTIVEDDIFGDFCPQPGASYALLDGLQQVIRIGSFSKTISASLRCGYIIGDDARIEALINLQTATQFGGACPLVSAALCRLLTEGGYRKHLDDLRARLSIARDTAARSLRALGIEPWCLPTAGFYLWCRLPSGTDSAELAQRALAYQLILAPGNVFSVSQTKAEFMRFNVAQLSGTQAWRQLAAGMEGMQIAAGAAAIKAQR